jgi:hypothetical protein
MTAAADLRRQWRAARTLDNAERARVTLDARTDHATATLAAALNGVDGIIVPGYRVTRASDGTVHVAPMPAQDARQLALWQRMTQEPTQ